MVNANYWRRKDIPILVQALNYMAPYIQKMEKIDKLPCYEFQYQTQIKKIKTINLNLGKNDHLTEQHFNANTEKYRKDYIFVYTDGSKKDNRTGFGTHCPNLKYNFSARLPDQIDICTAEMIAIQEAITYIIRKRKKKAIILTDSKSAIEKLNQNFINPEAETITLKTKTILIAAAQHNFDIRLAWIPGHSDIPGNEMADKLANIGRILNVPKDVQLNKNHITTIIKKQITQEHHEAWKESLKIKGRWYALIQNSFPKSLWFKEFEYIDRRQITNMIRMRSGHCLTNKYLHQIGIKESPNCECGQMEDLNHMILECPINKIPNHDIYNELISHDTPAPLSMVTILRNLNSSKIQIINKFLKYNKIDL